MTTVPPQQQVQVQIEQGPNPTLAQIQQYLAQVGVTWEAGTIRPRLIIGVSGLDGCGKTEFGLSAPKRRGLIYLGTDIGTEGVIEKWQQRFPGVIGGKEFSLQLPSGQPNHEEIKKLAGAVWDDEAKTTAYVIASGASSVVIDAADEVYQHLTLARFGKAEQVPSQYWGIVQSEYLNLMRRAYDSFTNLILVHKVKKLYEGKNWTGRWERAGYPYTHNMVQIELKLTKVIPGELVPPELQGIMQGKMNQWGQASEKVFLAHVLKCRHNTQLEGGIFVNPTFQMVAAAVMPQVPPEYWT